MKETLLEVKNLVTGYLIKDKYYNSVDDVSFKLHKKEVLAIVGESGCGKSTLATSIIRLHPDNKIKVEGEVIYNGVNILNLPENEFNNIRGKKIAMIFQDPLSSLNPIMTIGKQIEEGMKYHTDLNAEQRKQRVLELLEKVGIKNSEIIVKQYPHQLSGGMRQRVVIAIALACNPEIIIADEPTTALDVTIQSQILGLLNEIKSNIDAGIILITHDLGVVAEMADRVAVMYAGQIVEVAPVVELFKNPKHPYTRSLLRSILYEDKEQDELYVIEGTVPSLVNLPRTGCRFSYRTPWMKDICTEENPQLEEISDGHFVRGKCWEKFYFPDEVNKEENNE